MSGKDSKKRTHEVFERLNKLSRSPVMLAVREFRRAGLKTEAGSCYFHAGLRDFQSIELVASSNSERSNYLLTISWHIALAPGKSDLLVVITETGEQSVEHEALGGFRPLANIEGQTLLPLMRQPYTGISLLDAPRILGCCLEDALQKKGISSRNHQALQRSLSSAYQATLQPITLPGNNQLPHFKIAIPLLISPTDLFEAKLGNDGVESDDSSFMGIQIADSAHRVNQPVVDIINPDFLETYAKMAAEAADRLPQLIDQHLSDDTPPPATVRTKLDLRSRLGKQCQVDAWEKFRNL